MAGEKAWLPLYNNAASNIEQVLEAIPNKAAAIRPPTFHHKTIQIRRSRQAGHFWRSWDELIRDVLLWTPSHVRAKAGWPARTCIQQLCEDTGCSPDDQSKAMNDWKRWRERARDTRTDGTTWWWWWIQPYFKLSFFNLVTLFHISDIYNAKAIFVEEHLWCHLTYSWRWIRGFLSLPKVLFRKGT